jgi:glycosyltransferase involved in cell wall biosynthesis
VEPAVRKLSVVCPAFEEEDVLPQFHRELAAVLDALAPAYEAEIIFVDDGSRDRTLEVLRGLAAADPRVRYLSFSRNFGHQAAITAGLEIATGDAIVTLDSDLQHPPSLIPTLLAKWEEGYDLVLTQREDNQRLSFVKRLTSWGFYQLMRCLSETDVRASASDYRLLSRKALDGLLQLRETHRFLRGMVGWLGFSAATVTFQVADRGAGISKFTTRRLAAYALDALLSFSKVPLRLSIVLGLFVFLLGLGWGGYALARALFASGPVDGGWMVVLVALHLIGGCILCSLGLVGEYVGRVYEQVKGRPLYVLKETSPARPTGLATPVPKPYRTASEGDSTAA